MGKNKYLLGNILGPIVNSKDRCHFASAALAKIIALRFWLKPEIYLLFYPDLKAGAMKNTSRVKP